MRFPPSHIDLYDKLLKPATFIQRYHRVRAHSMNNIFLFFNIMCSVGDTERRCHIIAVLRRTVYLLRSRENREIRCLCKR